MNLNEFAKEVHALAVEKGFYDPKPTDADLIAAIHSEISEAFEEWRAGRPMVYHFCDITCNGIEEICDESCAHYDAGDCAELRQQPEPHGIAVELIDVVLRILDAAAAWGYAIPGSVDGIDTGDIEQFELPELITSLHSCAAMASRGLKYKDLHAEWLVVTLAYIFAWLRARGIAPEALMLEKHEYNKTRPYRHGGKRV